MDVLNEANFVKIMKEEWALKRLQLEKALKTFMKTPEGEKFILGAGTKVKHTGSGLLYTIDAVNQGQNIVTLKTPEGHTFDVDSSSFEGTKPEYELD